jgi:hypothetical protein
MHRLSTLVNARQRLPEEVSPPGRAFFLNALTISKSLTMRPDTSSEEIQWSLSYALREKGNWMRCLAD